jgi:hypothetical protein
LRLADDAPGVADRKVVLAEVQAIGCDQACDIGAIVDDEGYTGLAAGRADPFRELDEAAVVEALRAQLEHRATSPQRREREIERPLGRLDVDDGV